eukprot:TRINITY_DN2838_c0_g1_i1.p2 TRINITY_DN2838_c0_g1~~TRINITY_DN2838_c0_g1_i1.p2  ORF type:complete len:323 (-),score=81.90 TRINITY_DN2838_c0_g1_i1:33-1001(-)
MDPKRSLQLLSIPNRLTSHSPNLDLREESQRSEPRYRIQGEKRPSQLENSEKVPYSALVSTQSTGLFRYSPAAMDASLLGFDIWVQIFGFLPAGQDWVNAKLVCSEWKAIGDFSLDPSLVEDAYLRMIRVNDQRSIEIQIHKKKLDPSIRNNALLVWACSHGHMELVEILLQDERVSPSGFPFIVAAEHGRMDIVEKLIQDKRVDPTVDHNQALQRAAKNGHLQIVDRLLQDKRVDPTSRRNLAIRWASQKVHIDVINRLLEDDRVDPVYRTYAIRIACAYGFGNKDIEKLKGKDITPNVTEQQHRRSRTNSILSFLRGSVL